MFKKIFFIIFAFSLVSCFGGRSAPSNFYNLVSIDSDFKSNSVKKTIAVEVVSIPRYLDRSEIITIKNNDTELNISEFNRWAEPLSSSIKRIIVEDMSKNMPNAVVRPLNVFKDTYDYLVLIYINKFEGKFKGEVYLNVSYSVVDMLGNNIINKNEDFIVKTGSSYDDLVMSMSSLLSKLSENISKKISNL